MQGSLVPAPLVRHRQRAKAAVNAREAAVWAVAAILLLALGFHFHGIRLSNDSYHYLSEAANIKAGNGFTTSIIHFDVERRTGLMPAPMTTYPFGYPLLIALVSLTGWPIESSGAFLSGASFIAILLLTWRGGRLLNLGRAATRVTMLATLLSSWGLLCGVSIMTEALFTALSMAAVLLVIHHEKMAVGRRGYSDPRILVAANLLVSAAYLVRYAGVFLFLAVFLYFLGKLLYERTRANAQALLTAGVSLALISAVMWRNVAISGTWKGGNDKEVYDGVERVSYQLVASVYGLFIGSAPFTLLKATVAAGGILLLAALWALWRSRNFPSPSALLVFPVLYLAMYTGGMINVCAFTVIQMDPRYLYPLLPLTFLVAASVAEAVAGRASSAGSVRYAFVPAVALLLLSYGAGNLSMLLAPRYEPLHVRLQRWLQETTASGQTLREWLDRNSSRDEIISATRGNGTSYVLGRPILSFASQNVSSQVWDESAVRTAMERYGARLLILYPKAHAVENNDSPLFRGILAGRIPAWLSIAARTSNVIVLEFQPPPSSLTIPGYLSQGKADPGRARTAKALFRGEAAISLKRQPFLEHERISRKR